VAPESNIRDLKSIMLAHQDRLELYLAEAELFDHPTAKGDVKEYDWCTFLSRFLPTRYQVSKAFVIDALGGVSEQLDIVIHDRHYCPLFFEKGDSRYIPAESVYAVFDVKPEFDRGTVMYSADKVASVRRLHRTSGEIVDRGQTHEPREKFEILGGVIATKAGWNPPLGDPFEKALVDANPEGQLDLGIALRDASFEVTYSPELTVNKNPEGLPLVFFILRLFKRLQQLGTVSVIDLDAYIEPLRKEK
jgi:hypothetical protein